MRETTKEAGIKPKEPLMAVLLSFVFPGLGQIYAGRMRRGIAILGINIVSLVAFLAYFLHPDIKLHSQHLLFLAPFILLALAFSLFVPIDAYKLSKSWNFQHNFERKITTAKKILLIAGIFFLLFVFSPQNLILSLIRANFVQSFIISSDSMQPTLIKGDKLFINKAIYKRSEPKRGDIVAFIFPPNPTQTHLKRIAGLPGDKVEIRGGHLVINEAVQSQGPLSKFLYYNQGPHLGVGQIETVPADHYLVLGDNSAGSEDSRFWGFLSKKNLVGKVYKIWWPLDRSGRVE